MNTAIDWITGKIVRRVGFRAFFFIASIAMSHSQGIIQPDTKLVYIDVTGVSAAERSRLAGIYPISSKNEVNLPYIGKVKVPGWGYAALSVAIQNAYRQADIYPKIEVNVFLHSDDCDYGAPCIDISGEVVVGKCSIPIHFGKMMLSEALDTMRPKDSADLTKIEIMRDGRIMIVDATTKAGQDTTLKNHDIITVAAKNPPSASSSSAR